MNIVHEQFVPIFLWPFIAEIDHGTCVSMPTASRIGATVAAMRIGTHIVPVIGDGLDIVVGIGIKVLASLAFIAATLNHVIEMGYDTSGDKGLASIVEVDTPWIASSVGRILRTHVVLDGISIRPH